MLYTNLKNIRCEESSECGFGINRHDVASFVCVADKNFFAAQTIMMSLEMISWILVKDSEQRSQKKY